MKKIRLLAYATAILCSTTLISCGGTDEDNAKNELQREAGTNPQAEKDANKTDPNTPGAQAGDNRAEPSAIDPALGGHEMMPSQSIVENITSNQDLTTLASALRQAGLVDELNGTGPYTVLAPTNSAFDALPEGTLEDLMKPENKQRLVVILRNHVIAGKTKASDLQNGSTIRTAGKGQLQVQKQGERVMINGAEVVNPNVESSNGVIHVIDKVLVPANNM